MYFPYGEEEIAYLRGRDKALARVIDALGHIHRPVDPDLFSSVIHHIVGQQISTRAQATIWQRLQNRFNPLDAPALAAAGEEELQALGMTFRKAGYIRDFACKVQRGELDLARVAALPDGAAIEALTSLKGIGIWTAEMILLFGLQRPDVFSYGDLAIQRGLRMVYRHREIPRERFERYRRRFSPYGSVASLYLWAVAGGALPPLTDPALRGAKRAAIART